MLKDLFLGLAVVVSFAANASALEIAVTVTGSLDRGSKAAALMIVASENATRAGDLDENKEPKLPLLSTETEEDLKASYEIALTRIMLQAHESYIKQAGVSDIQKEQLEKRILKLTDAEWKQVTDLLDSLAPKEALEAEAEAEAEVIKP